MPKRYVLLQVDPVLVAISRLYLGIARGRITSLSAPRSGNIFCNSILHCPFRTQVNLLVTTHGDAMG